MSAEYGELKPAPAIIGNDLSSFLRSGNATNNAGAYDSSMNMGVTGSDTAANRSDVGATQSIANPTSDVTAQKDTISSAPVGTGAGAGVGAGAASGYDAAAFQPTSEQPWSVRGPPQSVGEDTTVAPDAAGTGSGAAGTGSGAAATGSGATGTDAIGAGAGSAGAISAGGLGAGKAEGPAALKNSVNDAKKAGTGATNTGKDPVKAAADKQKKLGFFSKIKKSLHIGKEGKISK
ncbi:hypothetical protein MVES1_002846 [Malassezia vespertilionis]|uniref:Uncharacterized protein n=1 Tax=Malassezia vespertilionis TaxID=2020962 RepID=A0A2N1JA43_9BASI|nr:uncharacterized protein MVES1_002846 [Malassezia vespertilionis]PKI83414.1 hypothetical protein MVES_002691 [Malassezia vespertilionis]WFD07480.1 hypothetical protein MVES1_002846 [Malassezia vespertilionis]